MVLLLGLVVFLYAFTSMRNGAREVSDSNIRFIGDNNLFITHANVSKLLIQNQQGTSNVPKETLDLNDLEYALNSNPMIKSAEVYLSVNGKLQVDVEQKKPIARISNSASYYIDDQGSYMPLSDNYSARVPLITGQINKNNLANVYTIANKVNNDDFLKINVVEIHQDKNNDIYLKLRQCDFEVLLGSLNYLDKKINNLKAFYQKSKKEKTLNDYLKVNLQFDNQVVCTKK